MTTIFCIPCGELIKRVFPETDGTKREVHLGTYCKRCREEHDAEMERIRGLRSQEVLHP